MNKREIYEGIVAEVEADKPNVVTQYPTSYDEAMVSDTVTIAIKTDGVSLKTPTSAFADYTVRDNLMLTSISDEVFALVLCCKVGKYFQDKIEANSPITQDDLEALAMVSQITVMWEQFEQAETFLSWIGEYAGENNLELPTLATLSLGILFKREQFQFAQTRKEMIYDVGNKIRESLDNE